jgi:hypothetical protein
VHKSEKTSPKRISTYKRESEFLGIFFKKFSGIFWKFLGNFLGIPWELFANFKLHTGNYWGCMIGGFLIWEIFGNSLKILWKF